MKTSPPQLQDYLDLITSQHRDKSKFMAQVAAEVQPLVDIMATLWTVIGMFTPDALGEQLDRFAVLVGITRNLPTPIQNVYFSFGIDQQGWGEGTWLGPNDSPSGLTVLPDDSFSIMLELAIAQNNWDGTIPGAYSIWDSVMGSDFGILIQDNLDMTMLVVFTGNIESVVTRALIAGGFFNLRPAGVRITEFAQSSIPNTPVFGFGQQTTAMAGWGTGCWIEPLI